MATARLYPTLSAFYKDKNIGFGSELDNIIICGVPEEKLYRKNHKKGLGNSKNSKSEKANNTEQESTPNNNVIPSVYPQLPTNDLNILIPETQQTQVFDDNNIPMEPSAPPLELLNEDFLRFLEDVITEQNLASSEDGTPEVDYTSLNVSPNFVLDESWIDDLQPDYDLSVEDIAADVLNNLNVEHTQHAKVHNEKSMSLRGNAEQKENYKPTVEASHEKNKHHTRHYMDVSGKKISSSAHTNDQANISRETAQFSNNSSNFYVLAVTNRRKQPPEQNRQPQRNTEKPSNNPQHPPRRLHANKESRSQDNKNKMPTSSNPQLQQEQSNPKDGRRDEQKRAIRGEVKENDNKVVPPKLAKPEGPPLSPVSPEYKEWMKWRKQVNRQLASVILLRRGDQIQLQKHDMSRKPLNQRSIDFVSQIAKSGNITSLGGKPYVMYGIPRASLSGSQGELY